MSARVPWQSHYYHEYYSYYVKAEGRVPVGGGASALSQARRMATRWEDCGHVRLLLLLVHCELFPNKEEVVTMDRCSHIIDLCYRYNIQLFVNTSS